MTPLAPDASADPAHPVSPERRHHACASPDYRLSINVCVTSMGVMPIGVNVAFAVSLIRWACLSSRRPGRLRLSLIVRVSALEKLRVPEDGQAPA